MKLLVVAAALLVLTGCASMTPREKIITGAATVGGVLGPVGAFGGSVIAHQATVNNPRLY